MPWRSKIWDRVRRSRKESRNDTYWVRAIPGAVPRSPLEVLVQQALAARPAYAWEPLVAEVARFLRRSESPLVLAVLEEGIWGEWLWPILAREELRRVEGVLLTIERRPPARPRSVQREGVAGSLIGRPA